MPGKFSEAKAAYGTPSFEHPTLYALLAEQGQHSYGALQEARSSARKRPPGALPPAARRTKLREREPW